MGSHSTLYLCTPVTKKRDAQELARCARAAAVRDQAHKHVLALLPVAHGVFLICQTRAQGRAHTCRMQRPPWRHRLRALPVLVKAASGHGSATADHASASTSQNSAAQQACVP
jgi:hypothetical protein